VGQYAWVIQEKTKGKQIRVYPFIVSGSKYMGWGFYNSSYDPYWSSANTTSPTPTSLAHAQSSPFFSNGYNNTTHSLQPSWLNDLFDASLGSGAADDHRNQLLAQAIPALSKPIGSNSASKFTPGGGAPDRNFNAPVLYADPGFWPRAIDTSTSPVTPVWYHSDMHDVAYPYLYGFYDELMYISTH
jgi:hypothetical protein